MEDRHTQLRLDYQQIGRDFVLAQIHLGLTLCEVAKTKPCTEQRRARALKLGQAALDSADKFMWKLGLRHPQFDEMMAQTERLRFELDTILRARDVRSGQKPGEEQSA